MGCNASKDTKIPIQSTVRATVTKIEVEPPSVKHTKQSNGRLKQEERVKKKESTKVNDGPLNLTEKQVGYNKEVIC